MTVPIIALTLVGSLVALMLAFRGLRHVWEERETSGVPSASGSGLWTAPFLLCCGVACFVLGQIGTALLQLILPASSAPPLWLHGRYLVSYPLVIAGAVLLAGQSLPRPVRANAMLDSLITVAAVAPFAWYVLLGPLAVDPARSLGMKIVDGAYPVGDLVLVFAALLLTAHLRDAEFRRVGSLLVAALAAVALIDGAFCFGLRQHDGVPDSLLLVGRAVGYTVLALGVARLSVERSPESEGEKAVADAVLTFTPRSRARGVWRYLLPYSLIPAVVALVAYTAHASTGTTVAGGVYLSAALLIELVFVHQFLAYRELIAYANRSARLESLAGADPVTGLLNHRSLIVALDQELARSHRYNRPCAVLFLDLDHFKALNDTFGHRAGDAALHEFGAVVRAALRNSDGLGRWGGEEFLALLPETDLSMALVVADRIRTAVASHPFWAAGGAHITCSLGVATYPEDAIDRDGLVELADRAMYTAKRLGRNQVRAASDPATGMGDGAMSKPGSRDEAELIGTVEALAALVESRDRATGQHVDVVARLAVRLSLALGLDTSEAHLVGVAGRLHDIGKVSIPDAVLQKAGALTGDEWKLMRQHPRIGSSVVSRVPALRPVAAIIRGHHERWDGRGYPDGLMGEEIPLCARILAVADAFSAMTTDRPYREALDVDTAVAEVRRCSGTQFDPQVVEALERVLAADPVNERSAGVA